MINKNLCCENHLVESLAKLWRLRLQQGLVLIIKLLLLVKLGGDWCRAFGRGM
jgi:hypothetical protein